MKKAFALLLTLTLLLALAVPAAMAEEEFVIVDGVLTKYNGPGGDVVIPDGVTSIGNGAFLQCFELTSVVIPSSVTSIGIQAFLATGLTSLVIPEGVVRIESEAFSSSSIASLKLPDSLEYIGEDAFSYCEKLESVVIPADVSYIGAGAFSACSSLTEMTFSEPNPNYKITDDVLLSKDGSRLICCAGGKAGSYSVPVGVSEIGESAFRYCNKLKGLTIPDSVTTIGDNAFFGCEQLQSITIPDSAVNLGEGLFTMCESLQSVNLPTNMTRIGRGDFYFCRSLTSLQVPEGVTDIGSWAFYYCPNLTSLILPESVKRIDANTFIDCGRLKDIYFGGSEKQWSAVSIGDNNTPLTAATIHYNSTGPAAETTVQSTLPDAVRYVPYSYSFKGNDGASFALTKGSLPAGLSLAANGTISGIPTELGVFSFTVTETYPGGKVQHQCTLSSVYQGAVDVEQQNVPGYGFVETATDNGRVDDQTVGSVAELTDQRTHLEGAFSEFQALYLDAQKLTRDVDYTAEEGSTVIVVLEETLARAGSGTHTLAAEFLKHSGGSSETVYTVQNFTLSGIGGKNVNVSVKGTPIVWWDAEPYIDTNSRTMCPFRIIGEALGLTAGWDGSTREAYFTNGNKTIYFPIDGKTARTSEGKTVQMDTAAVIVNGRTYAPVRYLAEYFGLTVGWDGKSRTVSVD